MPLTFKIATRNLLRNKKRTLITLSALVFNCAMLIALFAMMRYWIEQSITNITSLAIGQVQIHAPEYREDRSLYKSIDNPEEYLAIAKKENISASPRSYGYGLASIDTKSAGAQYWGIDPLKERQTFRFAEYILEGAFLNDKTQSQVVIGRKLARSLNASIGSELIAVVQAADGSMGNEIYHVGGILQTISEEMDRSAVIMHQQDFQELFSSAGRIHEIALNSKNKFTSAQVAQQFNAVAKKVEVKTWEQLLPTLADMLRLSRSSMYIFSFIFFLAVGFGVLNTMLMATHDRIREYGMLKALGTKPWRIIMDVCSEAFILSACASIVGSLVGVFLCFLLDTYGIDLSSMGGSMRMSGIAFDPVLRSDLKPVDIIFTVIATSTCCVLASLFPAIKAARLSPIKAMQNH